MGLQYIKLFTRNCSIISTMVNILMPTIVFSERFIDIYSLHFEYIKDEQLLDFHMNERNSVI